jgi:hypothetical protein
MLIYFWSRYGSSLFRRFRYDIVIVGCGLIERQVTVHTYFHFFSMARSKTLELWTLC